MAHSELTEYDDVEKYLVSIVNSALAGKTCKSVTACSGIVLYRKSHKNSNHQLQLNICDSGFRFCPIDAGYGLQAVAMVLCKILIAMVLEVAVVAMAL